MTSPFQSARLRAALIAALLAASLFGTAHAKGDFYAEGMLSDVRIDGTTIKFKFVGSVSFAYASAPLNDPKREWRNIKLDTVDVEFLIDERPERHDAPPDDQPVSLNQLFEKLSAFAADRKVLIAVSNPSFRFAQDGLLSAIEGTNVQVVPSPY